MTDLTFSMYFVLFLIVFENINIISVLMWYGTIFWILASRFCRPFVQNIIYLVLQISRFDLYFSQTGRLDSLKQKTFFKKTVFRFVSDFFTYISQSFDTWAYLIKIIYKERNSKKKQGRISSTFDKSFKLST